MVPMSEPTAFSFLIYTGLTDASSGRESLLEIVRLRFLAYQMIELTGFVAKVPSFVICWLKR